ncbi:hypothetical protein IFR05_013313 [Cadophora sp. M221]|nr:hypothetical protein IFR05_013313 [Cadophora sp. M221]
MCLATGCLRDQITLYGESAGAIAVHAHIHGPSPIPGIKRAILQSGSLYLTPPAPQAVGSLVMKKLEALSETDDLKNLPVGALLQGLGHLGFQNWWLHDEGEIFSPGTQQIEWPITGPPELEAILIGDCQWESRGFEPRIVSIGLQGLQELFARYSSVGSQIIELYQIDFSSMEAARPRVSAFINDLKFAFGSDEIFRMERELGKRKCFRYVVDQVNPWNHSAGAHHAIDLAFLFGGPFNYSHDESAKIVGTSMRESWITFINGGDPWEQDTVYGFGPKGNCRAIKPEVLSQRRRTHCINSLREIGWSRCQPLITRLMGARGVVVEAYLDDGTAWLTNDTKRGR